MGAPVPPAPKKLDSVKNKAEVSRAQKLITKCRDTPLVTGNISECVCNTASCLKILQPLVQVLRLSLKYEYLKAVLKLY